MKEKQLILTIQYTENFNTIHSYVHTHYYIHCISYTDLKSCTVCTRSNKSLHLSMMALRGANTGEFLAGHEHRPIPPPPPVPPPPPLTATEEPPNILLDEPATGWLWWCWGRCNWLPCTELMVNVGWELCKKNYGKLNYVPMYMNIWIKIIQYT